MKKEEIVSYVSSALICEGKIIFSGTLRVDGILSASVEKDPANDSLLIVGKFGRVVGNVNVNKLNVEGAIEGDFHVSEKAEFVTGSKFKGKIFTPLLVVQEGAIIEGSINVPDEKVKKECDESVEICDQNI